MDDRSAKISLAGKDYELLLTTKATKEIAKKYGGLSNLGEELLKAENFEQALDEIIWLIVLLANQPVLIHNLRNPSAPHELLTVDEVEMLTSPLELAEYKESIMECLVKGTQRNITSEGEGKNTTAV